MASDVSRATRRRPRKKLVSIRLSKQLIADLKAIAKERPGYQALVNEILAREIALRTEGV